MLADTLKRLHDAEEKADNIIAKANQRVQEIEKETYQKINLIEENTNQNIAAAVAALPPLKPAETPAIKLEIPQQQIDAAVTFLTNAVYEA